MLQKMILFNLVFFNGTFLFNKKALLSAFFKNNPFYFVKKFISFLLNKNIV